MVKVFYDKKDEGPKMGFPISSILRLRPTRGDVGLEIEVEASNPLLKDNGELAPWWGYHHDGSLRGNDNAEYVLLKPIAFDKVPEALSFLWGKFDKYKSKLDDSNRTSVHVHLNCQQFHLNRLTAFCALYFCFEEVLTEWCGDHRVGNLFCLRAKDAPAIVSQMKRFIRAEGQAELRDGLHYSGFNVQALQKFGSVEIRTLRGVKDPVIIQQWVNILQRLYKLSEEFTDPRDVCSAFSQGGPLAFFDNMLGEMGSVVRDGVPFNDDRIISSMYEGIRMAQDLCYCRDWDLFKAVDIKDDPFGRDPRKIVKSLVQTAQGSVMSQQMTPSQYQEFLVNMATSSGSPTGIIKKTKLFNPFGPAPTVTVTPPMIEEDEEASDFNGEEDTDTW